VDLTKPVTPQVIIVAIAIIFIFIAIGLVIVKYYKNKLGE